MKLLFMIIIIYLIFYLSIIIHELGHFAMGYILKLRPLSIRIGKGKKLITFKCNNTYFHLHSIAETGECLYLKDDINKLSPIAYILLSLSGALANFLAAIILLMVWARLPLDESLTICLDPFIKLVHIGTERLIYGVNSQSYSFALFEELRAHPIIFLWVIINLLKAVKNLFPFHCSDGDSILKEIIRALINSYTAYLLIKSLIQVFFFLIVFVNIWKTAPIVNAHLQIRFLGYLFLIIAFLIWDNLNHKYIMKNKKAGH